MSFLKGLWSHPEAIYHILKNTDNKIIQSNLATFIMNNFYCNYLSGNYLENNLLYIITMMLKDEIDELQFINQVNDVFLENSKCALLLEQLRRMPDIQIYFKNIILKTVEKLENKISYKEINLNILDRFTQVNKLFEEEKKKLTVKKKMDVNDFYDKILSQNKIYSKEGFDNSKEYLEKKEIFTKKYLSNIDIKEFEQIVEKAKNGNKINLFEY